jgi:Domain of unknown function(DUF2779)
LNTSPYQRIPFQWSLHHDSGTGILAHAEFLADGELDPRREFTESLLAAVVRFAGPIAVWSSFEATVIGSLRSYFPNSPTGSVQSQRGLSTCSPLLEPTSFILVLVATR